jgi:uncharacterized protein DUF5946
MTERRIACVGCGGLVPDIEGPVHRYMLAAPGCWQAYTGLLGGALAGVTAPEPHISLTVDAYAVQHPGQPNPQATQSVWVHLIALHMALERGWPITKLVEIRRFGADSADGWAWLEPPSTMGAVTAIDIASARPDATPDLVQRWTEGAWAAWDRHHDAVRQRASRLEMRFG